ncbi:hypothetical protein HMI55_006319 [Coelomomyces lativittatus]|nr:hypothetical protein HMI56_005189 [Coelomomyces lativittatus]KAJ1517689.1 hypothetical protein HMI55_006319 [Coelomomyces lativittatus]
MNYLLFGNTERCSLQDQEPPPPIPALSHLPSKETMYSTLQHYAPTLAAKWHPNDTRRIQRTLEHYVLKTKEKIQKNSPPSTSTPSHLQTSMSSSFEPRLTPTWLVFWVYRSLSQLDTLLDQRVDQMLELGLLKELEELHSLQPSLPKDRGIYQAIGCKEWDSYFEAKKNNPTMTTSELAHHYATCVQKMKMATQRYARKQLAWIQNRFWPLSIQSEHVHMYVIDGSSTGSTVSNRDPCVQALVQQFLVDPQRMPCPSTFGAPIINHLVEQHCRQAVRDTSTWQKFTCDLCQREMNGDHEWKIHLRSKKHLRHVRHLKLKQMKQVELIKCLESKVSSFHAT